MRKLRQFTPLVIEEFVKADFHEPAHEQNYYEIFYIREGRGVHHINGIPIEYGPGDVFVISPFDFHYADIELLTHFGVIKFTEGYLMGKIGFLSGISQTPDLLLFNNAIRGHKLLLPEFESQLVKALVENVLSCRNRSNLEILPYVFFQVLSIISIIQELPADDFYFGQRNVKKDSILSYIHQNISSPDDLRLESLADTFSISKKYFSFYFKSNFGISYRDYVAQYKLKLIQSALLTDKTIKQIVQEFGFTDESHLSHFFKKKSLITITEFRLHGIKGQ